MTKTRHLLLALLCPLLLLTGCGDDNEVTPGGGGAQTTNVNANDASKNKDLARWEIPHTTSGNLFISHRTSDGLMNYCLEYNFAANHSQWVAYRYDTKLKANNNNGNRTNAWNWDPALNGYKDNQASIGSFPGYNRGHLLGSAERYYSDEANAQTFYMTNMSPMNGNFNSKDWGYGIEDLIRGWGRAMEEGDTLYVVKGGTIGQPIGTINISSTSGKQMKMVVPKYYFAACLKRLASGNVYAIGFWIEHKDHQLSNDNNQAKRQAVELARQSAVTIDELERLTGLDFFCNMPDIFEDRVEQRMSLSQWSGLQ